MVNLDFAGKQVIYAHHLTVPIRPLVQNKTKSLKPEDSDNLIIHGDNLHALKALLPRYAGRVNCIYIDPPYNTGNEGWIYNDNVNSPLMQRWLKKEVGLDDLERHEKWLCMMWPRLQLLKELLADDGVIFISTDYNEEHHLRVLMDEIFGETNYRNTFVVSRVKKNIQEREKVKALNFGYNSILFYGKSKDSLIVPPTKFQIKAKRWHAFDAPGIRSGMDYELFGTVPPTGRHWMYSKERANLLIEKGRLRINPRSGKPEYLLDASDQTILDTNWTDLQEYDSKFNFPNGEKNVELIKRLISIIDDKGAIILDSFAGSGTTAHAVLALNKADGGNRKFILVECEDYADTKTAARVRSVIRGNSTVKSKNLQKPLGGSFVYCTLGKPLDVDKMLTGKMLPDYSTLASHMLYMASGISVSKKLRPKNKDGLFYSVNGIDYYLLYKPDLTYLRSDKAVLDDKRAERISGAGKRAVVFGPGKHLGQRELTGMGIRFCFIPDGIRQA